MWNKLSMQDKAKYIQLGVSNGVTSLDEIKEVYNKYAEGGPKRVHNNTSPTAELSTKLEDVVATKIRNDKHINHAYDIPYLEDKETKIIGYTVPTNALDSIAKYAGKTKHDLDEAVALAFESGYGRQPYFNYGTKNISDRAIGNMNYFKNYGSIPSHLFVRDYEYTKGGYNKDKPYTDQAPLEHAINFFRSGRYNTKLRAVDPETGKTINHTQKVKLEAKKLRKDPNYQKWKKQSGLDEYTGKAQQARDRQKAIDAENARKAKYRKEHPIKAYFKDALGIKYDDGGYLNKEKDIVLPEALVNVYSAKDKWGNPLRDLTGKLIIGDTEEEARKKAYTYGMLHPDWAKQVSYGQNKNTPGTMSADMETFNVITGGALNRLSPTQNIRLLYDIATDGNTTSAFGNYGIVSDKFAEEHPYWAMGINMGADMLTPGISYLKKPIGKAAIEADLLYNSYKFNPKKIPYSRLNNPTKWYRRTEMPEIEGLQYLGKGYTTHDIPEIPINNWRREVINNNIRWDSKNEYFYSPTTKQGRFTLFKTGNPHGNRIQASTQHPWEGTVSSSMFKKVILEGDAPTIVDARVNGNRSIFSPTAWEDLPPGYGIGFKTGELPMEGLSYYTANPPTTLDKLLKRRPTYHYQGPVIPYGNKHIDLFNKPIKYDEGGLLTRADELAYINPSLVSYNTIPEEDVLIGEDFFTKKYRRPDGSTYTHVPLNDWTPTSKVYTAKDSRGNTLRSATGKLVTGNTQQEANNKLFWDNYNNVPLLTPKDPVAAAKEAASYIPFIGEGLDLYDIGKDVYSGNYGQAALGAGLFLLPEFLEKPVKKGYKWLKDVNYWRKKYKDKDIIFDPYFRERFISAIKDPSLRREADNRLFSADPIENIEDVKYKLNILDELESKYNTSISKDDLFGIRRKSEYDELDKILEDVEKEAKWYKKQLSEIENVSPVLKNIAVESPQYHQQIYSDILHGKVNSDNIEDYVENLIIQANTFLRRMTVPNPEDFLYIRGQGHRNSKYSLDAGNPQVVLSMADGLNMRYGNNTMIYHPKLNSEGKLGLKGDVSTWWGQRRPVIDGVSVSNGKWQRMVRAFSEPLDDFKGTMKDKIGIPQNYGNTSGHIVFFTDTPGLSIADKFTVRPFTNEDLLRPLTLGYKNGGKLNK